ncbi:unnamed protein product [Ectocarpus sp. 12 AP-2014]
MNSPQFEALRARETCQISVRRSRSVGAETRMIRRRSEGNATCERAKSMPPLLVVLRTPVEKLRTRGGGLMLFSDTCCCRSTEHSMLIAALFPRCDGKDSSEVDTRGKISQVPSRAAAVAGLAVDATGGGHGASKC